MFCNKPLSPVSDLAQFPYPFHLPGQTDRLQIVGCLREHTCRGAQSGPLFGLVKQVAHAIRQSPRIEETQHHPGFVVPDRLAHRLGIAGNERAANAHRLQQTPTQDERIGQVDMHGGELQKRDEVLVGDIP